MLVAHLVVAWIAVLITGVYRLAQEPEWLGDWRVWVAAAAMLALVPVIVIGWWAVRLLVGAWVRAQPPDPLDR